MAMNDAAAQLKMNITGAKAAMDAAATTMAEPIRRTAECVTQALRSGRKLLVCGNGGSAAEASHLSGEIVGRYRGNRQPYPCICLADMTGATTCIGNDFGYDEVFARQVEAFGQPGDVLIVFSTSGNSTNIVKALQTARARHVTSVAMLGRDGGKCRGLAEIEMIAPGSDTARIQEVHMLLLHTLCDLVEQGLGHA